MKAVRRGKAIKAEIFLLYSSQKFAGFYGETFMILVGKFQLTIDVIKMEDGIFRINFFW
jgi:hypothetical protein